MARGRTADDNATRVAANGYHYTKVPDRGWVLTHWLTMEQHLGRQIDPATDMVKFKEPKYKRDPYNLDGLVLIKKKTTSLRRRKAQIEARIAELQAELSGINAQLNE